MLPTGRTEGVYIKVSKGIKKLIEDKRKKESFNLSEWLEEKFVKEFLPSIDKIEKEKKSHLEAIAECDKKIDHLLKKDEAEKRLILTNKEQRQLIVACDPQFTVKRQWGLFCSSVGKKYSLEEFIKIKNRYKDKIYM